MIRVEYAVSDKILFYVSDFHEVSFVMVHPDLKMDGSGGRGGPNWDLSLPKYKVGKTLGIGSFGKVKMAEHLLTGLKVAIKILNKRKIKNMQMQEKGLCSLLSNFLEIFIPF